MKWICDTIRLNRKLDENGFTGWYGILTVIVIIMLVGMSIAVVIAARGNPFEKKKYAHTEVKMGVALDWYDVAKIKITDTNVKIVEKNYFDTLGWFPDPFEVEGNLKVVLKEKVDGTWQKIDTEEKKIDFQTYEGWEKAVGFDMGPFSEDATKYELEYKLYTDGELANDKVRTGDL